MTYRKKLIEVALPLEAISKQRPESDFGVTSVNYDFAQLLARATMPS
jgi:hypothetical protein